MMDANMSEKTKEEVMFKLRARYRSAGREHRKKLIDHAVDLMGYHRKSAIRTLSDPPPAELTRPGGREVRRETPGPRIDCALASRASSRAASEPARADLLHLQPLGDDLYSHEPFCRQVLLHGFPFLFTCKPSSHTPLYGWVAGLAPGRDRHVLKARVLGKNKR